MFGTVLVANRGEIACRIIRTLHRMGIRAVAVHSDADERAKHVREADRSLRIGEAPPAASYLNVGAIVGAAREAGADAVHPGYGFLSENAGFARACLDAGVAWIGPSPEILALTGDKIAARRAFEDSGFPVLPGAGPLSSPDDAAAAAGALGYPLMVKIVMGGGGIGMGVARDEDGLRAAVATAATRGERFFGDASVYVERYVGHGRHVEVQVLADERRAIHLHERECSVQRRHQKVIEETPSPALDDDVRGRLCAAAADSMRELGYRNAGTVECVLAPGGEFFFLEVNARIQVEHPITEVVTGVDVVEEQLRIAAGEGMSLEAPPPGDGHAIELRVCAEDPGTFLPSPGRITALEIPAASAERRFDLGYDAGDEVSRFYDSLIGKVVVHAGDRTAALAAARRTLEEFRIEGVKTNVPALIDVLDDERFRSGGYDTGLLGK